MKFISSQKIITGNRVTLPTEVRQMLGGLSKGDFVNFVRTDDDMIIIRKAVA